MNRKESIWFGGEELQRVPVERDDQPAEEGPGEGLPLVPGRDQRGIQQEQRPLAHFQSFILLFF